MTEIEKESVTVLKKLRDAYYKCEPDSEMKDAARLIVASALDVAIFALECDRWISVNQRLPKEGQVVLAQGLRSCTTGQFQGITTAPRYWWWKGHTIKEVTHWRPLPEPPKEETE